MKNICRHEMSESENVAARRIQAWARAYMAKSFTNASQTCSDFDCPICIDQGSWGIRLSCKHSFHVACITKWLTCERSCPLCRAACEDVRATNLNKTLSQYKEVLNMPIETLLNFKSAIDARILGSISKIIYTEQYAERFFRIAQKNKIMLDESQLVTVMNKWNQLMNIKKEIMHFDKRISALSEINVENDVILESIRCRLCLPFEQLYGRVRDSNKELSLIRFHNTYASRCLRNRLCCLWNIEKLIEAFISSPHPISRGIIPFSRRLIHASVETPPPPLEFLERLAVNSLQN